MKNPINELSIDASAWVSEDDVYDAVLIAIGAPDWHGRNIDALMDSVGTGRINEVEGPYRLTVINLSKAQNAALDTLFAILGWLSIRGATCTLTWEAAVLDVPAPEGPG